MFPGFQRGDIKGISRGVVEAVAVEAVAGGRRLWYESATAGYRRHKTAAPQFVHHCANLVESFLKFNRALIRVSIGSLKLNRAPKGGP